MWSSSVERRQSGSASSPALSHSRAPTGRRGRATHTPSRPASPRGHYHMTKALPQFIFLPVYFPFAFLESCCITEAGNSDVPLKSQWTVLT
ncbi:hypothetical protein VULLAG_LOCUS14956 [Vulpes lagopus]